jgi:hypothetical protein
MNKILKWILIAVIGIGIILFAVYRYNLSQTKKHSPEDTVEYVSGDLEIEVFYNRPYKKERQIFGGLVPYDQVWRTGANEATTFETSQTLTIDGRSLPAGKYTLWTIPGESQWQVIFNDKMYSWGVNLDGEPSRDPEHDVLTVTRPVEQLPTAVEQFTISVDDSDQLTLVLEWDRTRVVVPLE